VILTIPRALPSWNQFYAGVHWAQRRKLATLWHALVAEQVRLTKKHPPFTAPVTITVTRSGPRAIDPDNICAKLAIDGLVRSRVLWGDDPAYVESVTLRSQKSTVGFTTIEIQEV
jgi:hypothetical protein